MTDILIMPDGSRWKPTSSDTVECVNCSNEVDTPEETFYPDGNCPDCGESWTGSEKRSTTIVVTMPEQISEDRVMAENKQGYFLGACWVVCFVDLVA